jgi:hypothetical protein
VSESGFDSFPYLGHAHWPLGGSQHLDDRSLHDTVAEPCGWLHKRSARLLAWRCAIRERLDDNSQARRRVLELS